MKSADVRQSFVDFFAERGHRVYPSAPLVPHGDPTLLFTNAGMVPFKNFFLGAEEPPSKRAVSVQKCMRVSGKHNDLENVGPSHRHHTFFEMLGNFSFGDYFKEDAIRFGWELVTEVWGVPAERLWATVFEEDDEAAELWTRVTGIPAERVRRCGAADNFWAMGDTGPCGPCSEIFFDRLGDQAPVPFDEGSDSGRYVEIWNLVFMQFERHENGDMVPLPDPSIDTGAGLERVTTVLQGVESNYDTDLFQPLIRGAGELADIEYGADGDHDVSLRVIADHLRAVSFLLADGVIPANEGRGYVLRRILRRAVRHGMSLGFEEPFLHRLLPIVGEIGGDAYPELTAAESSSRVTVESEEHKFLSTLAAGSRQVQEAILTARHAGADTLSGQQVFYFYDTLGLPLEVLREIAEEEQFSLDEDGFDRELEAQRSRSRASIGESRLELEGLREAFRASGVGGETRFDGYRDWRREGAEVRWLGRLGDGEPRGVDLLDRGERGVAVLDATPFYAEAGGQLGDRGRLSAPDGHAVVADVQRQKAHHFHFVEVEDGELRVGDRVTAVVDDEWRRPTQRNHTATHLLHAALRHVLRGGVRQAGSLVAPDRLRFDFTYGQPLTDDELARIEGLVNRWIRRAEDTEIVAGRSYDDALEAGAMALFGEKYGDTVRTVAVPALALAGGGELASLELCGGCHVANTGEIGLFVIVSERAVASGVRRIEARTGEAARHYLGQKRRLVERLAGDLGVAEEQLADEVAALGVRRRELEKELQRLRVELVSGTAAAGADETEVEGIRVVIREVPPAPANETRHLADVVRGQLGSGVVVLASRDGQRVSLVTAVSSDLTARLHAGTLARDIASLMDGKGGGRPDFAQAGGRQPGKLPEALEAVPELVKRQLAAGAG